MNSKRLLRGLIVFCLSLLLTPGYGSAENQSDAFLQQGIAFYRHNDLNHAIDQFARALLANPHNQRAFENLMMAAAEDEGLTAEQKINLFLLGDMARYIRNLDKKIKYLEHKRDMLRKDLRQRGIETEDPSMRREAFPGPLGDRAALSHTPDPLGRLTNSLTFQKEQRLHQLETLEKQVSRLYELKKMPAAAQPPQYPRQTPAGDVALLKQDLALLRIQFDALKDHVENKDKKIAQLTAELVDFALKLTEKEMVLEEKLVRLSSLQEGLFDLQSRFELEQKMMRDKNSQIQLLQDQLKTIQSEITDRRQEFSRLLSSKDEKLIELNEILEIYKGKLADTVKELKGLREESLDLRTELRGFIHAYLAGREIP